MTFSDTTRLERIVLIARAMKMDVWVCESLSPFAIANKVNYDPYTNAEQNGEAQERFGIAVQAQSIGGRIDYWIATKGSFQYRNYDRKTAIADCVAKMRWEIENA